MLSLYFKKRLSISKLFKWEPNVDLLVGIFTLLCLWISYYAVENIYKTSLVASLLIFIILTNIFINVIFPIWWVVFYRKQPLSDLGITSKLWLVSISLSIALAFWRGVNLPHLISGVNWVPHLIVSALIFWEPFFVFGWLQSRYEKSFGILPAIILTASSLVLYHIGSISASNLVIIFFVNIICAITMAFTRNLLALWPIYWCIGSSVNSLRSGMHFGWDMVAVYGFALVIQFGYILYAYKKQKLRMAQ